MGLQDAGGMCTFLATVGPFLCPIVLLCCGAPGFGWCAHDFSDGGSIFHFLLYCCAVKLQDSGGDGPCFLR